MAIEIRNLTGNLIDTGNDPTDGVLQVTPIGTNVADPASGVLTHRKRSWAITAGEIQSATVEGGQNYRFEVYASASRQGPPILAFEAGVPDEAGDISFVDLYLDSVDVEAVSALRLYEGDFVDRMAAPDGATDGQLLGVNSTGGIVAIDASVAGDSRYEHIQGSPSATWTINHNLGKKPSVTVLDSAGDEVVGSVNHTNTSQCVVTFSASFAGTAYCN